MNVQQIFLVLFCLTVAIPLFCLIVPPLWECFWYEVASLWTDIRDAWRSNRKDNDDR